MNETERSLLGLIKIFRQLPQRASPRIERSDKVFSEITDTDYDIFNYHDNSEDAFEHHNDSEDIFKYHDKD